MPIRYLFAGTTCRKAANMAGKELAAPTPTQNCAITTSKGVTSEVAVIKVKVANTSTQNYVGMPLTPGSAQRSIADCIM